MRTIHERRGLREERVLLGITEPSVRRSVAEALAHDGYEVVSVPDGLELLDALGTSLLVGERNFALIIADAHLAPPSPLEVLAGLRRAEWHTPFLLIVAHDDDREVRDTAMQLGAVLAYRPLDVTSFFARVHAMIARAAIGEALSRWYRRRQEEARRTENTLPLPGVD